VTEVLGVIPKPWFNDWRQKNAKADQETRAAQTLGTKVHAAACRITREEGFIAEPEIFPHTQAVRDFLGLHVKETLATELSLVSDKHAYGGTLDLYCQLWDGTFAVVDYKTTSQLTREHGLQLAAYALLCREHGMTVNKRIAVRIKKEAPGKFYARTYADHKGDVEAFLALKTYWHWLHRNKLERAA
jgi:predicted RecB family nuclease